jgi:biopolymer transport protein ExbB
MKVRFITVKWAAMVLLAAAMRVGAQGGDPSASLGGSPEALPTDFDAPKTGDMKVFHVKTDDDLSGIAEGDKYRNEDTVYELSAIKTNQNGKGGEFTAKRIDGQTNPQRRWVRVTGAGPLNISMRTTLMDLYKQGGVFLHPIALLFIAVVILTVNGIIVYRSKVQCPSDFVAAADEALMKGDMQKFRELSQNAKGLMAFICRQIVRNVDVFPIAEVRNQVRTATITQVSRLRIPVRTLNLIAVAAPLLGLLGTIVGMVLVFEGVAGTSGAAKASILAAGIRVKLFSTATALIVAIPALFLSFIFGQKLHGIVRECDEKYERFMALIALKKGASEPGGPAGEAKGNGTGSSRA